MSKLYMLARYFAVGLLVVFFRTSAAQAGDNSFETYGDIASYGIPAAAAALSASKTDYEGLLQLGLTFGASLGATMLLKHTIKSTRPNGGLHSFPSGHTSRAFAGASYLHYRYGLEYGLPAYALAFAVGYSRVESDNHHWHDVIAGAVLGHLTALLITDRYASSVTLNTFLDGKDGTYGVAASFRF
jgi:membrane-associated phospholipid phosphatase